MKTFLILVIFCMGATVYGQRGRANKTDESFAAPLAKAITHGLTTNRQKAKAIFDWIAENISYQVRPWYNRNTSATARFEVVDPSDTATVLKPLNERVADLVIRRREAYCDGYARLFKTLCDYNNIPAEIITGYSATTGIDALGTKFKSNHNWNAVYLDSSWHLLDVTWASGFTTFSSNEFIRRYNDYYFLTPPQLFASEHYPEDLHWTLLNEPPAPSEFRLAPYKLQGYITNKVVAHAPAKGTVVANVGDSLYFTIKVDPMKFNDTTTGHNGLVQPLLWDTLIPNHFKWVNIYPSQKDAGFFTYYYRVENPNVQYINLILNDRIILRYRLKATVKQGYANSQ